MRTRQFLRWYLPGSFSASLISVYSRKRCPHLPKPTPTSRIDFGLNWRIRLMTVGMTLGRLLGMSWEPCSGLQMVGHKPFICQNARELRVQMESQPPVVVEPPE